jgi:hypothetical protein
LTMTLSSYRNRFVVRYSPRKLLHYRAFLC